MDHNLAFACVGYGSVRVLRNRDFSLRPFALPSAWILQEDDPVQFCIDAMREARPDFAGRVDEETRSAIKQRLEGEAKRAMH